MSMTKTVNGTKSFSDVKTKYIFQRVDKTSMKGKKHTHMFYEIIYILSGECEHFVNNEIYSMKQNSLLILYPGDYHCFVDTMENTSVLCISIAKDEFQKYENLYGSFVKKPVVSLKNNNTDFICKLLNDTDPASDNDIRILCSFLLGLYTSVCNPSRKDIPAPLLELTEKMSCDLSLLRQGATAMLHLSNYSKTHLNRLLKKYYNATIHSHLKNMRLKAAWKLIMETDMTAEEISARCGYSCYGYFTNIFKEKYGITPAILRKTKH